MKNFLIQIIKGAPLQGYSCFQIGFVFAEYDLHRFLRFFIKNFIYTYKFSYKFDTVLYQFLETGTSDRTLVGLD